MSFSAKATDNIKQQTPQQIQCCNSKEANKIILEFDSPEKLKEWQMKQEDNVLMKILPLLVAFVSLIGSVLIWYLNEKKKRKLKIIEQKEERYKIMVTSIKAFTQGNNDVKLRQEFIDQLNLSWVYCPDIIIKKGTFLLETMIPDANGLSRYTNEQKVNAIGELFVEIRKDILTTSLRTKTKLKAEDYKSIGTT